jgi:hypothetical protein
MFARIAQSVEQGIENPRVGGSIPPPGTTLKKPRIVKCGFTHNMALLPNYGKKRPLPKIGKTRLYKLKSPAM